MSRVSSGPTTQPPPNSGLKPSPSSNMCENCHQRPKYPPYDYCGRRCGADAKAVGSQTVMIVLMCKQCNQKPVYLTHEFCGRRCANAWASAHGQPMVRSPPSPNPNQQTTHGGSRPQNQYQGNTQSQNQQMAYGNGQSQGQQTVQDSGQPGQKKGGVKGFVKGFKNLVSSSNSSQQQQQQQQQTKANPTQTQQPPDDTPNPAQNTGIRTTPLMLTIPSQNPTNGSTSNQTDKKRLGPFNGAYPISPPSPTDGNTKPRLGPFNGAYPISPPITVTNSTSTTSKRWSPGTSLCNLPPETKEPASSQNEKPRLGPFNGAYPISPPSPTDKDTGNQSAKQQLGPFNGAYPSTPLPTLSTSPGSSVQRVSSDTSQGSTQETKPEAVWSKMTRSVRSSESLSYASEHENPYRDPGENEEEEDGEEEYELVAGDADTQSIDLSVYPPSTLAPDQIGICRLDGCSKPTFVDSITDLESEYCSLEHHEEAAVPAKPTLCIMCRKTPKGSNDHFCSAGCREKALRP